MLLQHGGRAAAIGLVLAWGLLLASFGPAKAQAVGKGASFGPAPAWVEVHEAPLDAPDPADGLSQGRHYLLSDEQVRVAGDRLVRYRHIATRAVNERGVEDIANVQISFDPNYQTLTVHRLQVRRGGEVVARAAPAALRLLQRESSLESLVYDGRLTAHVALPDVRVGDVVEYAYSVQGSNPAFGAARFGSFDLEWGVPVAEIRARLLWPRGRPLYWKHHNEAPAAEVVNTGSELDHRWTRRAVPARLVDADSPGWYDPYRWVEWGEFADWGAVVRWALPLYRLPTGPLPAVDREVARIAAETGDPQARLLAALRFVQREVRYLGIEMGANSHAPHPPQTVLQRRFGDCKDKTLLTLTLLARLGIPARPALVHTTERQAVAERLPTPWAFNHVLVRAELNGQPVWLDPTRTQQGGRQLAQWVQSDHGQALVIAEGAQGFSPMAGPQARLQRQQLKVLLDASAGYEQPARLTITTHATGAAAENLRGTLASQSRDRLQKDYLDYYAATYRDLAVDQPMEVRDDLDANAIELVERYRMPRYWTRDDKTHRWNGNVDVPDLMGWLSRPKALNRQAPLALRHPVDFTLVSEFRLPGPWAMKPDPLHFEHAAFEVRRDEVWKDDHTLVITDRYLSRRDHVPAADMTGYVARLDEARKRLSYTLYHADAPAAPRFSAAVWVPWLICTVTIGGLWVALWRLWHWDPEPAPLQGDETPLEQIGGWLWLPALGLLLTPWRAWHVLTDTLHLFDSPDWLGLVTPGEPAFHPLWAPLLLLETAGNLTLVAGALPLLVLLLQRRSNLPRLYLGWWAVMAATLAMDGLAYLTIPAMQSQWKAETGTEWARAAVVGAIWVSYFLRSARVRRTFRQRRPSVTEASPPAGPAPESVPAT